MGGAARPPRCSLFSPKRAVVEVVVTQAHTEGHGLVTLAALNLGQLGPVQQQRQLCAAQEPVLCGAGWVGGEGRGGKEGSVRGAILPPGHPAAPAPSPAPPGPDL